MEKRIMTKTEYKTMVGLYDTLYADIAQLIASYHRGEFKIIATDKYGYGIKAGEECNLDSLVDIVGKLRVFFATHE